MELENRRDRGFASQLPSNPSGHSKRTIKLVRPDGAINGHWVSPQKNSPARNQLAEAEVSDERAKGLGRTGKEERFANWTSQHRLEIFPATI